MMIFDEFFMIRKIFDKQNKRIFLLLNFISKGSYFLGNLRIFKDAQSLPDLNVRPFLFVFANFLLLFWAQPNTKMFLKLH